jgi:autotransporter-associated beta strand protein
MKQLIPNSKRFIPLGLCLLFALVANHARAGLQFWDPQGAWSLATYTGGSLAGTWETSDWTSPGFLESGQASPVAWIEGNAASFAVGAGATNSGNSASTTTFTITMNANHTVGGIFDGAFDGNSGIVTIAGTGTITLASGDCGFDVWNSGDASLGRLIISNVIAGTDATSVYAAQGNGQQFLRGVNTYSGGTQLGYFPAADGFPGILNFNNSASFGTGPIIVHNGAGALVAEGSSAITLPNAFDWSTSVDTNPDINIVGNPAGITFSGNWNLGATAAFVGSGGAAANVLIISGVISGTGSFTKNNAGVMKFAAANTYTGPTTVSGGTLEIQSANGLASTTVTVATGATLKLDSNTALSSSASLLLNTGSPAVILNYAGSDLIQSLSFDGGSTFAAPGTWGAVGSSALNQDSRFTGSGVLNVGVCNAANALLSIVNNGGNSFTLNFQGTFNATYAVLSQTNITQPMANWNVVPGSITNLTDGGGVWSFTVTNAAPAFYRSKALNACP